MCAFQHEEDACRFSIRTKSGEAHPQCQGESCFKTTYLPREGRRNRTKHAEQSIGLGGRPPLCVVKKVNCQDRLRKVHFKRQILAGAAVRPRSGVGVHGDCEGVLVHSSFGGDDPVSGMNRTPSVAKE